MGEGRGATGLPREAMVSLFRPTRNTVLLLLGLIASTTIWFGVMAGPALGLGFALKLAAMLVAAMILALSQFRDLWLALSVVLSALPGAAMVFAGAFMTETKIPLGVLLALVYALGFVVALIAAERFVLQVVENEDPEQTAISLLRDDAIFLISILIVSAALPVVGAIASPSPSLFEASLVAGANAAAVVSAWIAVPLLGSFLRAGEDFIARTNRIREGWTRRLDPVMVAARSPWAWSASGILLVVFALAFFGSMNIARGPRVALAPTLGSAAFVIFVGALLAARDLRRAVAVFVVTGGSLGLATWGFARAGASLDATHLRIAAELVAISFLPIAATAAAARRSARDDAVGASAAGVEAAGPSAAVGMLAAIFLIAPWYREADSVGVGAILALVFAACGALVFQPALAGVLETLVPRRKTLQERYRVK